MTADDDLRRAAQEIADREAICTDGETGDESCVYCEAFYPNPKHKEWCSLVLLRAALAARSARSDITQAATGGPDFTPKEWPEPRAEGLREAWAAYTIRFADPDDPTRHSETKIRDAFEAGWIAATPPAEGLDVELLTEVLSVSPIAWQVRRDDGAYVMTRMFDTAADAAAYIAREYAALAPEQPE